jgi:hypothetical protein
MLYREARGEMMENWRRTRGEEGPLDGVLCCVEVEEELEREVHAEGVRKNLEGARKEGRKLCQFVSGCYEQRGKKFCVLFMKMLCSD